MKGFRLPTAWPLVVVILGFPIWWASGLTIVIWPVVAVPMLLQLVRRRPVKFPPGFVWWVLFLAVVIVSGVMVNQHAPGTLAESGGAAGHYLAYGLRLLNYLAVTVVLLYVGNLTERELPRSALVRLLGGLFVLTMLGGLAGTVVPRFGFSSPLSALIPGSWRHLDFFQAVTHVHTAQIQDVLRYPRPSAPFEFTNSWGNNLSVLSIWFVIACFVGTSARWRRFGCVVLAISVIPIVYSQNRAMWAGIVLGIVYLVVRLASLRRTGPILGVLGVTVAVGALVIASPLGQIIGSRAANPHSNEVRGSLFDESLRLAEASPLIGYGSTRSTIGSDHSLTIGASPSCPRCGNRVIGSTGQLSLVLVAQGFLGAFLYLAFLLHAVRRYWRDRSVVGFGGVLVVLLAVFYSAFYVAVGSPLAFTMIGLGLLWRNETARSDTARHDIARHDIARHDIARHELARAGTASCASVTNVGTCVTNGPVSG